MEEFLGLEMRTPTFPSPLELVWPYFSQPFLQALLNTLISNNKSTKWEIIPLINYKKFIK